MKAFYRFFIFSLALLFLISCAKKEDVNKDRAQQALFSYR